jgi:anti-anti-sigma factor
MRRPVTTSIQPQPVDDATPDISVTIEPVVGRRGDVRVQLVGELDAWTGPMLADALAELRRPVGSPAQRRGDVRLELHGLSFLDSTGLSALVENGKALVDAGWTISAGPAQPQVSRLLRYATQLGWLPDGALTAPRA